MLLTAGYLLLLLRLTVFRPGCFTHGLCRGRVNLAPGIAYRDLLSWGSGRLAARLFWGNIVCFIPLGVMGGRKNKGFAACMLLGGAVSLLIETGQFVLGSGVLETDDLLLNTLGTLAGGGLHQFYVRIKTHAKDD